MNAARDRNIMLLLLCLTAGIVDVIGYLSIGHVFTANMTGNIVLLGLSIGNSLHATAVYSLIALFGFIIGVIISAAIVGTGKIVLADRRHDCTCCGSSRIASICLPDFL